MQEFPNMERELLHEDFEKIPKGAIQIFKRKEALEKLNEDHPLLEIILTSLNDDPENRWEIKKIRIALDAQLKTIDFQPPVMTETLKNDKDLQEEKKINSQFQRENAELKEGVSKNNNAVISIYAW